MRFHSDKLHYVLVVGCDLIALVCAWYIALCLTSLRDLPLTHVTSRVHQWRFLLTLVLGFWVPIAMSGQLYRTSTAKQLGSNFVLSLQAIVLVVSIATLSALFFANLSLEIGREFISCFVPVSCLALFVARRTAPGAAIYATRRWPVKHRFAVIADGLDPAILDRLRSTQSAVLRGIIVPVGTTNAPESQLLPVLGTTGDLAAVINRERLDKIILLNGVVSEPELRACNSISKRMGVTMSWALALPEPPKVTFSMECGMHVLEMPPVSFTRGQRTIKRIFDVVVASVSLVLLLPVMLVLAALVKISSKGTILHRAPRVGRGGRYFTFIKFRTMYADTSRQSVQQANERDGHLFKVRNDPRVTRLGRFLRRYSLDELPQLFNVLAGDMSLVGPRPLPVEDMDPDGLSSRFAVWSEQRATVPPGITGLWQIRGRGELPFQDLVKYDLEYVYDWSLALDLKILLKTPMFVLSGKGAY